MVARANTVAFQGIEVVDVGVQVQMASGLPAFTLVGLPDKAVAESRERVRAALHAMGLALPPKRITVNLSPADLAKEGNHFDLPIAIGLLAAMDILPMDDIVAYSALGELALDGTLLPVAGILPAAVDAAKRDRSLICPAPQGGEAAWAGDRDVVAAPNLLALVNHFRGTQILANPAAPGPGRTAADRPRRPDLAEVRGQETAKRVLEIAAAGCHNLLMMGPPGSGKSMLAARLPGLLPPLTGEEVLEVSMIHSLAGLLEAGRLTDQRPFREPHHSASMAAIVGGGNRPKPGEISLAHRGVLFLDELPEFHRTALEALRQPIETGFAVIARANGHVRYPARFQLVAAMNPCRCGYLADSSRACLQAPACAERYQNRISGPLLDRFDLFVDVPAVRPQDLALPADGETSAAIAERVVRAQEFRTRMDTGRSDDPGEPAAGRLDAGARDLLLEAAERLGLSARAYYRVQRVAATIADLDGCEAVSRAHLAETLSYRFPERRGPRARSGPYRQTG